MSCNSCGGYGGNHSNHCVVNVVMEILRAQRKVADAENNNTCVTGCDQSIEDLLSPTEENPGRRRHNTIPFILFNKCDNKPFFGVGVSNNRRFGYNCVESPIFRVKDADNYDENCVRLELLLPTRGRNQATNESNDNAYNPASEEIYSNNYSVCNYFQGATALRATGICITVDLNCFCGISCLDATTPIR